MSKRTKKNVVTEPVIAQPAEPVVEPKKSIIEQASEQAPEADPKDEVCCAVQMHFHAPNEMTGKAACEFFKMIMERTIGTSGWRGEFMARVSHDHDEDDERDEPQIAPATPAPSSSAN